VVVTDMLVCGKRLRIFLLPHGTMEKQGSGKTD